MKYRLLCTAAILLAALHATAQPTSKGSDGNHIKRIYTPFNHLGASLNQSFNFDNNFFCSFIHYRNTNNRFPFPKHFIFYL